MAQGRPLIVVLPGIGGSVLARPGGNGQVVWDAGKGDIADLVVRPARMSVAEWPRLEPIGLTRSTKLLGFTIVPGYGRLLDQLSMLGTVDRRGDPARPVPGADVVAVPYDFRYGVADSAKRLDAVVRAHLGEATEQERAGRVVVVAHSMGGLVARYWMGPLDRWRWCRALITLGTPHRGAPKALDWLVNGVRVGGMGLSRPTRLVREWPSVAELLPRYRAVRDTTASDRLVYPHELPIPGLASGAKAAYKLHCEIERAWRDMPRDGPEMVAYIGWSHPTPDAALWDGTRLTVTKTPPDWLDRTGWEQDFGDGTVPAVCALPIEQSHHVNSPGRVLDRHTPMACTPRVIELVIKYLRRASVEWIRGEEDTEHRPAIGLDLDELYPAGEPIRLTARIRQVEAEVSGQPVWATLTPVGEDLAVPVDVRLDWDTKRECFIGILPWQADGLYEVRISAQQVPGAGDLWVADTIAVLSNG
jgi:pimeloyl-ACP methyl ester carboxylesterase